MAGGPLDLRGTVRIVDRASGPLRRVSGALTAIGRQSGVMAIGRAFSTAGTAIAGFGSQLSGLLLPLGGLLGLGAGFGLVAAIQGVAGRIDQFAKFGRIIGMTAQNMRELEFAANRQGASFATVQSGLFALSKRSGELAAGTGGLYTFLKKADPALIAQFKGAKTLEEQLALTIAAYEKFNKVGLGNAFLAAAFSRGAAVEMARLFQGGKEGLRGLTEEARKYMGVLNETDRQNVEDYTDSLANMEAAWRGISLAISRHVLPVLTPLINDLAKFFSGQKELIGLKVGEWFKDMADWGRSIDWSGLYKGVTATRDGFMAFANAVGGVNNVLIGLGVLMAGPFIASFVYLITALQGVAAAIVGALGAPFVAIVAAAGVAAYGLWRDWKRVSGNISTIMSGLGKTLTGFAQMAVGVMTLDWDMVQAGWQTGTAGLVATFQGAIDLVVTIARSLLSTFDGLFGTDLSGLFDRAFDVLPKAAERALAAVRSGFTALIEWLKSTWVGQLAGAISGAFSNVKPPAMPQAPAQPAPPGGGDGDARVIPQSAPVSAETLLRRASFVAPGNGGVQEKRATLDINLPQGVTGKFSQQATAGGPAFETVRLNRGPSMRGEVAA